MIKGKVRWYNASFGYGFITGPEKEDVFVHYTVVPQRTNGKRMLCSGEWVHFRYSSTELGFKATEVKLKKGTK